MTTNANAPIKSDHAQLLNRLAEMQQSPYYKTCSSTLMLAEQTVVAQEKQIAALQQQVASKAAEVEALTKDAERYRYMREYDNCTAGICIHNPDKLPEEVKRHIWRVTLLSGEKLDECIDICMEQEDDLITTN